MKRQLILCCVAFVATALFSFGNAATPASKVKVYTIDEIIVKAPSLVGQTVQVKGLVDHVCAITGRKIFFITKKGNKTIRVDAGEKITKFDPQIKDKVVLVSGVVKEQKQTQEDLDRQEAKAIAAKDAKPAGHQCTANMKANGEDPEATLLERIKALKERLKKQIAAGKNNYLSFYSVGNCEEYSVVK